MPRMSKRGFALIMVLLGQLKEECGFVPVVEITQYGPRFKFMGPKEMRGKALPLITIFDAYCGPSAKRKNIRRKK